MYLDPQSANLIVCISVVEQRCRNLSEAVCEWTLDFIYSTWHALCRPGR